MDAFAYCREIETYLCRRNGGHLIRVVGPAFELVRGWAAQGVPLKIALRGIDRYCERYYAKGPKRRPVHIEFCESDVLDAFDDWRRAVGVSSTVEGDAGAQRGARRPGLASHIERLVARLTGMRASAAVSSPFVSRIDDAVADLDGLYADARHARGDARARVIERLAALDRALLEAAKDDLDPAAAEALAKEAQSELASFWARMTPDARQRASAAAFDRLLREAYGLPVVTYE
jgi:hypothetical protein